MSRFLRVILVLMLVILITVPTFAEDKNTFKFTKIQPEPVYTDADGEYYSGKSDFVLDGGVYMVGIKLIPSQAKLSQIHGAFPMLQGKCAYIIESLTIHASATNPEYQEPWRTQYFDAEGRELWFWNGPNVLDPYTLGEGRGWKPIPNQGLLAAVYTKEFGPLPQEQAVPAGWKIIGDAKMGFSFAYPSLMNVHQFAYHPDARVPYGQIGINTDDITIDFGVISFRPPKHPIPNKPPLQPITMQIGAQSTKVWANIEKVSDPTYGNRMLLELFLYTRPNDPIGLTGIRVYMATSEANYETVSKNLLLPMLRSMKIYR